jgi:hypothetical protein
MTRSGRVSINAILIVALVTALAGVVLLVTARKGPTTNAASFMDALAKKDSERLAKLSIIGNDDYETKLKKWQTTIARTEYYLWSYKIVAANEFSDTDGAVKVEVNRNPTSPSSYGQPYQLMMHKENGEWKVVAPSIPREMYPALPR